MRSPDERIARKACDARRLIESIQKADPSYAGWTAPAVSAIAAIESQARKRLGKKPVDK